MIIIFHISNEIECEETTSIEIIKDIHTRSETIHRMRLSIDYSTCVRVYLIFRVLSALAGL